jgi:hypothetical protein
MTSMTLSGDEKAYLALRESLESYSTISDVTWQELKGISKGNVE